MTTYTCPKCKHKTLAITIEGTTNTGKTVAAILIERILTEYGFSVNLMPNRDGDQDTKRRALAGNAFRVSGISVDIHEVQLNRDGTSALASLNFQLRSRIVELEKALEGVPQELIKAIHYREALDKIASMPLCERQMHNAYEMRQIARTQRRRAEAAEAERDLFRDLLERIEQHPQLSPCPDLRAEIREATG